MERHSPYSEFRVNLSRFEDFAKELLNDTLMSTRIRLVLRSKSPYIRCALENHSAIHR